MVDIVDCTLRDGGYYTDWDFEQGLVYSYLAAVKETPIGTVELGYRSPKKKSYHGKYFYLSKKTLLHARKKLRDDQKIAIMLNAKDCNVDNILDLVLPVSNEIDIVRFAVAPNDLENCIKCVRKLSHLNLKFALNIMYLHQYVNDFEKIAFLENIDVSLDYVSFVDSYGSVFPNDISSLFKIAADTLPQKLGFHGHANIDLAFANALMALDNGCTGVDCTFLGMGRGAGNLQTELFLAYLSKNQEKPINNFLMTDFIEKLAVLKRKYEWGTSLPYMVSGLNSVPQGEVMELLSKNRYSLNSCLKTILKEENEQQYLSDKIKTDNFPKKEKALIIGGGNTVKNIYHDIITLIKREQPILFLSSIKYFDQFIEDVIANKLDCFIILSGDEYQKIRKEQLELVAENSLNVKFIFSNNIEKKFTDFTGIIFYAEIPNRFDSLDKQNPINVCFEMCKLADVSEIQLVGFDGYIDNLNDNLDLQNETEDFILEYIEKNQNISLTSLTKTIYPIETDSIFFHNQNGINE